MGWEKSNAFDSTGFVDNLKSKTLNAIGYNKEPYDRELQKFGAY